MAIVTSVSAARSGRGGAGYDWVRVLNYWGSISMAALMVQLTTLNLRDLHGYGIVAFYTTCAQCFSSQWSICESSVPASTTCWACSIWVQRLEWWSHKSQSVASLSYHGDSIVASFTFYTYDILYHAVGEKKYKKKIFKKRLLVSWHLKKSTLSWTSINLN